MLIAAAMLTMAVAPGAEPRFAAAPGNISIFVGHNFSWITPSDIHFEGDGYDFTVKGATAHDLARAGPRPDDLQYVLRVGYQVNEWLQLTIGVDHLKYLMRGGELPVEGRVDPTFSDEHGGTYAGETVKIGAGTDLVDQYEHTDGANLIDMEALAGGDLWFMHHPEVGLRWLAGFGVGVMILNTDARIAGVYRDGTYHLGGYAITAVAGLRAYAFRRVFAQLAVKGGLVHIVDAQLPRRGRASQVYGYIAQQLALGVEL